jgi:uncharacterized membrane protein
MKTNVSERKLSPLKLTLIVAGLISLFGLGIDSGRANLERWHAQRAADSAAQAGALAIARGQDFALAAQAQAAEDGYDNNDTINSVLVNYPPQLGCSRKSDSYAGDKEFVQVVIHSDSHLYFAQVVGVQEAHTCVEAVRHIVPSTLSMLE